MSQTILVVSFLSCHKVIKQIKSRKNISFYWIRCFWRGALWSLHLGRNQGSKTAWLWTAKFKSWLFYCKTRNPVWKRLRQPVPIKFRIITQYLLKNNLLDSQFSCDTKETNPYSSCKINFSLDSGFKFIWEEKENTIKI